MDVTGDDAATNDVEGGIEGDQIEFKVAGQTVGQTGVWHSGTNTNLDLSIDSAVGQVSPTATPVKATQAQPQPPPVDEAAAESDRLDTNTNQPLTTIVIVAAIAIVSVALWFVFIRRPKVKP